MWHRHRILTNSATTRRETTHSVGMPVPTQNVGAGQTRANQRMSVSALTNTTELLHRLLATRILILDGAMGTMIQRYRLEEADFRGRQFADHPRDYSLKGFNDLICLTQPQIVAE